MAARQGGGVGPFGWTLLGFLAGVAATLAIQLLMTGRVRTDEPEEATRAAPVVAVTPKLAAPKAKVKPVQSAALVQQGVGCGRAVAADHLELGPGFGPLRNGVQKVQKFGIDRMDLAVTIIAQVMVHRVEHVRDVLALFPIDGLEGLARVQVVERNAAHVRLRPGRKQAQDIGPACGGRRREAGAGACAKSQFQQRSFGKQTAARPTGYTAPPPTCDAKHTLSRPLRQAEPWAGAAIRCIRSLSQP